MFYEIYYQTLETRKIRLSTLTMKFPIQAIQEYYYITHLKYNIKKIFSRSYLEPEYSRLILQHVAVFVSEV